MESVDRPGTGADNPNELGGAGKAPERPVYGMNLDRLSLEDLLTADAPSPVRVERADKPHEVKPPQADSGYYPTIPQTTPERLTSVPVFDGPPRREQITQGVVGDCGVLSTIGAVAGHRPDTIKNLIKPAGDGKFEVTLHEVTPAAPSDPVARPTGDTRTYRVTDEIPVASHNQKPVGANADRCGWPALVEKVIAAEDQTWDAKQKADWQSDWSSWHKYSVDRERWAAGLPPSPADAPAGYNRLDIGSTSYQRADLLAKLTGEEAEVRSIPNEQQGDQALLDTFRDQLADGKPVLVGTRPQLPTERLPYPPDVFAFGHAYEVTKVEGGKIHLHNPWGELSSPPPMDVTSFWEYFREYNPDGTRTGSYTTLM
jgi:hypothetical protein